MGVLRVTSKLHHSCLFQRHVERTPSAMCTGDLELGDGISTINVCGQSASIADLRLLSVLFRSHAKLPHAPATTQQYNTTQHWHNTTQVEQTYPKEEPLIVGCQMGPRSTKAVGMLEAAGYTSLMNVEVSHACHILSGAPAL